MKRKRKKKKKSKEKNREKRKMECFHRVFSSWSVCYHGVCYHGVFFIMESFFLLKINFLPTARLSYPAPTAEKFAAEL